MPRRFNDAKTERLIDNLIRELVEIYGDAGKRILANLSSAALSDFQRARLGHLQSQVESIARALDVTAADFAERVMPDAYRVGANIAEKQLALMGLRHSPNLGTGIHLETVQVIAETMSLDLIQANASIVTNVGRALRATKQTVLEERTINQQIVQGIIEGEPRRITSKRITDQLIAELGEGKLVTAGSRHFTPESYAELVARTRTREAVTQGSINSAAEAGMDLFQVSVHDNPCATCMPFQGRVFSRSGTNPNFPPLADMPPYHPRCRHVVIPVTEKHLRRTGEFDALVRLSADDTIPIQGAADFNAALGKKPDLPKPKRKSTTASRVD